MLEIGWVKTVTDDSVFRILARHVSDSFKVWSQVATFAFPAPNGSNEGPKFRGIDTALALALGAPSSFDELLTVDRGKEWLLKIV